MSQKNADNVPKNDGPDESGSGESANASASPRFKGYLDREDCLCNKCNKVCIYGIPITEDEPLCQCGQPSPVGRQRHDSGATPGVVLSDEQQRMMDEMLVDIPNGNGDQTAAKHTSTAVGHVKVQNGTHCGDSTVVVKDDVETCTNGSQGLDNSRRSSEYENLISSGSESSYSDYTLFTYTDDVREISVENLLKWIISSCYNAAKNVSVMKISQGEVKSKAGKTTTNDGIALQCKRLFQKDYFVEELSNDGGVLCQSYPNVIYIPVTMGDMDKGSTPPIDKIRNFHLEEYAKNVELGNTGRCRKRFPVPVILRNGKFICRSGSLGNLKTKVYETITQVEEPKAQVMHDSIVSSVCDQMKGCFDSLSRRASLAVDAVDMIMNPAETVRQMLEVDCKLLQSLKLLYICDLMVEKEKIHTLTSVSSSEKAHSDSYSNFKIVQMPYPGCEFFASYREAKRRPEGLKFDWSDPDVDVEFKLPEGAPVIPDIDWSKYKEWDLVELTQNYLLLMIKLVGNEHGMLIHCISGWDRTPLFVSLLRLSLWADGLLHPSMSEIEMTFFTLAYDWFLFGHNTSIRIGKGEEILHFCFNFLPYISSSVFSAREDINEEEELLRRDRLHGVGERVTRLYEQIVGTP